MRGATIYLIRFLIIVIFLLTRLMRGATVISDSDEFGNKISTHAPLARRDNSMVEKMAAEINFYSRASCEARPQHLVWHNTNTAVVPQEADKIKRRLSVKNCFSLLLSCFFRRSFPKNQSHLTFA